MNTGFLILALSLGSGNTEPKTAQDWLTRATADLSARRFADAVTALTQALRLQPDNAQAIDLRGNAHFLCGKFAESVADFDRYIQLRPQEANGHWKRGISLYYAGKYAEGKKQFEGYEKVDTNDVENAVWHFLCAARKDGLDKARAGILKIGKDGRTPMMQVYELFKGKLQPADVLAAANAGKLTAQQRRPQLFYAHLYLGLYHDVRGEKEQARKHLALAANTYRISHYMGEVARVHLELLQKNTRK